MDQRLTAVQQPVLSSGDVGTVRVEYVLDSYWDGFTTSGVFFTGKQPEDVYEQPLTDGACVIPWEVLQEDGILYIGLRGVDEDGLVKTAAAIRYRVERGSPCGSATAAGPTPDIYQQMLATMNETKEIAQDLQDDAARGAFDGKSAYDYAKDGGYAGTEAEFAAKLAKALPVANVLDYGAKGDGSADDTAAFKAALAAERVLFVPGGTYKLTSGITISENCTLELAQDAVLNFTNTTGNCITLLRLANLKGNHATINVPYAFTGRVINCDTGDDEAHLDPNNLKDSNATAVPPFTKWSPQWKMSRYMTDVNICKPKSDGEHNSADGSCSGTAVYLHCNEADFVSFMWGVSMSGVRIAGAFDYGIRAYNIGAHVESWNHDMRIEAVVDACKVGVSLENCYYARLEVSVQARAAANGAVYATHGIELRDSRGVDMSGSRVWDWNGSNSLWASGNQYQHLALYGECRGLILDDFMYYENSTDIRDLIYTNKASNLEQLTILQEPVTRWFKSKDGEPVFSDGLGEKKLITEEQLNAHFGTALVKNFTDVLATATDENGAILDGKGYTGGYLTGTGALYTGGDSKAYYVTTGFIPCAKGQTAYVEGMSYASYDGSCTLCMYDANKKFISTVSAANLVKGNYWYATYQETAKGFSVMPTAVVGNENVAYIRFTVLKSQMGEHPMIAVDEEIKYTVEGVLADGIKVKGENVIGGGSGGGSANIDVTAQVGQTIIVKEVDASGKPTKWEAADLNNIPKFTLEEVNAMGLEFYNAAAGANTVLVEELKDHDKCMTYVLTRSVPSSTDSDFLKAYPGYDGYACFNGKVYGIQIYATGSFGNERFHVSTTDERTISPGNVILSTGMIPTWKNDRWEFIVHETNEPLVLPVPLEYVVDGATLPLSANAISSALTQMQKFPYAVINATSDSALITIPVIFISFDPQTYTVTIKCVSPKTNDIITMMFAPKS